MPTGRPDTFPRLLADIGGTNARFALHTAQGITPIATLASADFPTVQEAIVQALHRAGAPAVRHAALAIATPVQGDTVRMTNHHWAFSIAALRQAMGWDTLLVLNDFTALALALPDIPPEHLQQVGGGTPVARSPLALLGPGTGLGVSGLIPGPSGSWLPLAGEGGHVSFAPFDDTEIALWRYARARFGHVSAERLLSGPGLQLIHAWLGDPQHHDAASPSPAEITAHALSRSDSRCMQTVDLFCALLGTVAADLALTLGATGGVYIGGGIVPRLGPLFAQSRFRARFEDKGRFSGYLARIPVFVIHHPDPAFLGVAKALEHHLTALS
ncbi:MAG: glucokinase [Thiomonas sp.]